MAVVSNTVVVAVLAVVKILILVSENRELSAVGLFVLALLARNGCCVDVLVSHGSERDREANHGSNLDTP